MPPTPNTRIGPKVASLRHPTNHSSRQSVIISSTNTTPFCIPATAARSRIACIADCRSSSSTCNCTSPCSDLCMAASEQNLTTASCRGERPGTGSPAVASTSLLSDSLICLLPLSRHACISVRICDRSLLVGNPILSVIAFILAYRRVTPQCTKRVGGTCGIVVDGHPCLCQNGKRLRRLFDAAGPAHNQRLVG